ncbi:zinc-dependent metalloprotease [Glaciecola sp. MH2013]|uniref:zinc-dependent metalloprotease n=1 Tax=Glaciecola sp. MH2013 TaxID=2785524 RepID=UPI00189F2DCB|nr:zinc-dependent metalloprotease [Glaciecola sp. MH2013]MBF7073030.1 zinc-dependent metalloprotease [Glaciecola sp. MH2013]
MKLSVKSGLMFVLLLTMSQLSAFAAQKSSAAFFDGKTIKEGFIDLYYDKTEDKVYLGLKPAQFQQQMIFQSSLPQGVGSNDIGLDRGQLGDTRLVTFERFGNKVLLKQLNTGYRASSTNAAERQSIDEAFADSVIAGFTIANESLDANGVPTIFIDYTAFLLSDIHGVSSTLSRTGQGGYSLDSSRSGVYLPKTKSFQSNTELEALVTFAGQPQGQYIRQVAPDAKSVTVHLHHSFIALPDDNYETRVFHPYSGFWKHSFVDYSVPIEANMEQRFIPRHRLAKQNPEAEISEAVEPIVYYLDPGIPEPVMTALREGALWWDQAFAAAGYKNAFQVKVLPEGADPMDVRYNVIQWVHRATRGWSYGSSVIDPRTGEIIKGHVTLGSLRVRQDYLIALGMTSPFDTENSDISTHKNMALDRIRQLSAHEVGHTLGIAHNFAASENNRASVMDYPHPLFELEKGKVVFKNAYDKGIGEWDKYVVQYGYQDFPAGVDESIELAELVAATQRKGLLYKSDPDARISKRASADGHLWDNGRDAIDEFQRLSEVRKVALENFGVNSLPIGDALSSLEERLVPIYYSHRFQLNALVKQLSGVHYYYEVKGKDAPKGIRFVEGKKQHQALELMLQSASADYLRIPASLNALITPKAYGSNRTRESTNGRMGIAFDAISAAEAASGYSVNQILEPTRLNRLAYQHNQDNTIPSPEEVFQQVFDTLIKTWSDDVLEQRIRQTALSIYFDAMASDELAPELKLSMQAQLLDYQRYLEKNDRKPQAKVLKQYLAHYWQTGVWLGSFAVKQLPPGSPI